MSNAELLRLRREVIDTRADAKAARELAADALARLAEAEQRIDSEKALRRERDEARSRARELEATCAAMREALKGCSAVWVRRGELRLCGWCSAPESEHRSYCPEVDRLTAIHDSTDAGSALLKRLEAAEARARELEGHRDALGDALEMAQQCVSTVALMGKSDVAREKAEHWYRVNEALLATWRSHPDGAKGGG